MSTTLRSSLASQNQGTPALDHTLGSSGAHLTERTRTWRNATTHPRHSGDLTTDLAASLFLSLFVTPVGSARAEVTLAELAGAVQSTGPRGIRAAGHGGEALLRRWERAGLIAPVASDAEGARLLPRGVALLNGPFRWDRLTRALRRHLS